MLHDQGFRRQLYAPHMLSLISLVDLLRCCPNINPPNVSVPHAAVVFVYDYHPASHTLASRHFSSGAPGLVIEADLWSYIIQLTSALRYGCLTQRMTHERSISRSVGLQRSCFCVLPLPHGLLSLTWRMPGQPVLVYSQDVGARLMRTCIQY
jgi:hypothetical protein